MRRGFTLIELLVVIAIIAVLAGLLFPVFARAKGAAKSAVTISNLKQLGAAFALYGEDSDDVLPPSTEGSLGANREGGWMFYSEFGGSEAGRFDPGRGSLYPYVGSQEVFRSPLDRDASASHLSFAFNGCLIVPPFRYGVNPSVSATGVSDPSGMMLLGEEGVQDGSMSEVHGTNDGFLNPQFDGFAEWHTGGTAILFVDSHAKIRHARDQYTAIVYGGATSCW